MLDTTTVSEGGVAYLSKSKLRSAMVVAGAGFPVGNGWSGRDEQEPFASVFAEAGTAKPNDGGWTLVVGCRLRRRRLTSWRPKNTPNEGQNE